MSMKDLEKSKVENVSITEKNAEKAARIQKDIDEVYRTLEALPDGLDQEITDQIVNAENAAKEEAGKDGDDLETAQTKTNRQFEKLCDMVMSKIKDNDTATTKLESIKAKYGTHQIKDAVKTISDNTKQGETVISESEIAMRKIAQGIQAMRDKINKK